MTTYHVERHSTVNKNKTGVTTKWHVIRENADGTITTLRKYARQWEATNARDALNKRINR